MALEPMLRSAADVAAALSCAKAALEPSGAAVLPSAAMKISSCMFCPSIRGRFCESAKGLASAIWALLAMLMVDRVGFEPTYPCESRFTVCRL